METVCALLRVVVLDAFLAGEEFLVAGQCTHRVDLALRPAVRDTTGRHAGATGRAHAPRRHGGSLVLLCGDVVVELVVVLVEHAVALDLECLTAGLDGLAGRA